MVRKGENMTTFAEEFLLLALSDPKGTSSASRPSGLKTRWPAPF